MKNLQQPDTCDRGELTLVLEQWTQETTRGDSEAFARLVPLVIDELRTLAAHHVRNLGATPTLQPTAIVNEAFLRLANRPGKTFPSRAHFFALASKVIRDLLVDYLRRRGAAKRGGGVEIVVLDEAFDRSPEQAAHDPETILALHELLNRLERRDPRRGQVVELRFFAGLTMGEIANVTQSSKATVERDWQVARRWLVHELGAR